MKLPQGFLLSGINCGIKEKKLDLGLIYSCDFSKAVGVFTVNANPAYSVLVSKRNIKNSIKAILVNSGNANCHSHEEGLRDTEEILSCLAKELKTKKSNILIASTGIIGKKLPKTNIINGLPKLIKLLGKKTSPFASSILTTDTFKKKAYAKVFTKNGEAIITGFAKGAGMIYPNLATLLAFILTDVDIPYNILKKITKKAVAKSFNSISVDGCMSTNDMVVVVSSKKVSLGSKVKLKEFSKKLEGVCLNLAKMIVKDAEGASKFIEIQIKGARSKLEARKAGMCLANSNLFKCAIYGANSNWGRVVSALGQAGIKVADGISVKSTSLAKENVVVSVDLKKGSFSWQIYTCDLTPEYIKINAEYN